MGIIILIIVLVAGISVYDYYDSRNWQSSTSISRNSVIFENRNKKYGAYHLRRDYNDSLGIIIGLLVLFIAIVSIVNMSIRSIPQKLEIPVVIDTIAMTITAPPVEEVKTLKTPFKVVGGGSGREGKPSNDPVKPPTPQTAKVSTVDKSDVHTTSGNSKRTNADNKTNPASSIKKGDDELAYGGGGEKGTGTGKFGKDKGGIGSGNGTGDGEGNENGTGGVVKRRIASDIPNDEIESNVNGYIYFKLTVDADGDVVAVINDTKRTTITDAAFLSKIMSLVKKHVKYNKRAGSAVEQISYAKKVNAT